MRVSTGASGAIGSRLVPRLIDAGHEVTGAHARVERGAAVSAGREAGQLDLLDARADAGRARRGARGDRP